jgi:hypothetical protein
MKKLVREYRFVWLSFVIWIASLSILQILAPFLYPLRTGYLGPIPWANFDGIHYLTLAKSGYFQYGEAFFPFYPILIANIHRILPIPDYSIGMGISLGSTLIGLVFLYRLVLEEFGKKAARWSVVFALSFPTSFFFAAVYTEGLFFALALLTVYFVKKDNYILAGTTAMLAGATRFVGIFLIFFIIYGLLKKRQKARIWWYASLVLAPLGCICFMYYLYVRTGDPLAFFHVQPAFGANRSGGEIILFPQVLWRYAKIIWSAFLQPTLASYAISLLELMMTFASLVIVWIGIRYRVHWKYLFYSLVLIVIPTLSGTFSSMPRYMLSAFPLFVILALIRPKTIQWVVLIACCIFQIFLAPLFLRGWFVA